MCQALKIGPRTDLVRRFSRLAQLVEHPPFKRMAVGSSPTSGSCCMACGLQVVHFFIFLVSKTCSRSKTKRKQDTKSRTVHTN